MIDNTIRLLDWSVDTINIKPPPKKDVPPVKTPKGRSPELVDDLVIDLES